MKRVALALVSLALASTSLPTPGAAVTADRGFCEAYCLTVAAGCYVFLALPTGRDKCEEMYEGCVSGCYAALVDDE